MHIRSDSPASAEGMTIGVVVSRYHAQITDALAKGARDVFARSAGRAENLIAVNAPGAFELPVLAAALASRKEVDAVVAIGCVISGETSHDRHIADSVAHALQEIAITEGKPITFGVLTCQTIEQARARAGGEKGNKGADAMTAAINAVHTMRSLHGHRRAGSG